MLIFCLLNIKTSGHLCLPDAMGHVWYQLKGVQCWVDLHLGTPMYWFHDIACQITRNAFTSKLHIHTRLLSAKNRFLFCCCDTQAKVVAHLSSTNVLQFVDPGNHPQQPLSWLSSAPSKKEQVRNLVLTISLLLFFLRPPFAVMFLLYWIQWYRPQPSC